MNGSLQAGAAARAISPLPEHVAGGVYLGGYGFYGSRRAEGVHDDIFCRSLVLSDGDTTLILLSLDLVGLAPRPLLEIRRSIARMAGLPIQHILLACTHSHASPDMQGLWGGVPEDYLSYVKDRCVETAGAALANVREAQLGAATATVEGLTHNRRGWDHTDSVLAVVRASGLDGAPIATLVNFGCHPTVTSGENLLISCDFAAGLVASLERDPGGVALFVNGAQGDAIPATGGGFQQANGLGGRLAQVATAALSSAEPLEPPIELRERRVAIPLRAERLPRGGHTALALLLPAVRLAARRGLLHSASRRLAARGSHEAATALAGVSMFAEGRLMARRLRPVMLTSVGRLRIGKALAGFAVPGEVMTRLAEPLRASLSAPHRLFLGLTNDTLGYFLPADEWMTGRNESYEESVSLGREAGSVLASALRALATEV